MTEEKFIVPLTKGLWIDPWPEYFDKFWTDCNKTARLNGWDPKTVANHRLRPLGGKLVVTKTHGWYLRWDSEEYHTAFLLRWS